MSSYKDNTDVVVQDKSNNETNELTITMNHHHHHHYYNENDYQKKSLPTTTTTNNITKERIDFLCFDLAHVPRSFLFIVLTIITFACFLLYGYMQELLFRLPGFGEFSWFLTLVQFFYYTCFAYVEAVFRNDRRRKIPLNTYFLLAFLTVATMGLSNASVAHLNYPTQVMFKCCKLIPVLIGGILIQGKKFNIYDVSAAICMSIGLIFFTLADVKVQPIFELWGVILICGALCADAAIGNVQEKEMKAHKATNVEVVLYSYAIGFIYILIGEILFDRPVKAFTFWIKHPIQTYGYSLIFSFTGYIGITIVLYMVKYYGALIAVTVTTCRKSVTIMLSFLFFAKPFSSQYLWAGLLVIIGVYLNIISKNSAQWEAKVKTFFSKFITIKKQPRHVADESIV